MPAVAAPLQVAAVAELLPLLPRVRERKTREIVVSYNRSSYLITIVEEGDRYIPETLGRKNERE
jgi:hypothetical protein